MHRWTVRVASVLILAATTSGAQELVTEAKASFIFNGERILISRDNPQAASVSHQFIDQSNSCGPACVAPMQVAPGVATLGELEVLSFLTNKVAGNMGLMVDARLPEDRAVGYIPGTVSLPHSTVAANNSFKGEILRALGAREFDGLYNFADARELLIYDGGPSSDDAGRLVQNLLAAGYPAEKLSYYRGGMQVWSVLGFSMDSGAS